MKNSQSTTFRLGQGLCRAAFCLWLSVLSSSLAVAEPKINFSVDRVPQVRTPQDFWAFGDAFAIPNAVHDDFLTLNPDQSSQIYLHLTDVGLEGTNELEIPATPLGLSVPVDFFNLDALMRNRGPLTGDPITNIFFSIADRPGRAEGASGSQVEFDALLAYTTDPEAFPPGPAMPGDGSTAGNIYYALTGVLECRGSNFSSPALEEIALGLKPDNDVGQPQSIQDEDNLDALHISAGDAPAWESPERVYFSIVGDWANIPTFTASAIWVSTQGGSFSAFATAEDMGLVATRLESGDIIIGDDVDAIIVFDNGFEGVLEPGIDAALFSVRPDGPSELDPGTVFYTDFDGTFEVAGPANVNVTYDLLAANLGLMSGDQNGDGRLRPGDGEDPDVFDNLDALEELQTVLGDPPRLPFGVVLLMLDFGDNPTSYGAAVHITAGLDRIGTILDWEFVNQASIDSLGDDVAVGAPPAGPRRFRGGDDEDGVTFNPAGVLRVDVAVSSLRRPLFPQPYRLDLFFDTNADGVYTPPPGGVDVALPIAPINVPVPAAGQISTVPNPINLGFDATAVNSRFRLGYDPNQPANPSPPVGLVQNGEVEDEGIVEVADFGDAPDGMVDASGKPRNYQTLFANDGPCYDEARLQHFGLLPGALFNPPTGVEDGEPDGQPTLNADGDDINKVDDEDGVAIGANNVVITVQATRPGNHTYLVDGWFDLNDNGVFDHPAEHVIGTTVTLDPGPVPIAAPASTTLTFTNVQLGVDDPRQFYSRFRLTFADGVNITAATDITPTGEFVSPDQHGRPPLAMQDCRHILGDQGTSHGEVEDYPGLPKSALHDPDVNNDGIVDINDLLAMQPSFGAVIGDPRYNERADVNKDGKVNIVDLVWVASNL